MDAEVNSGKGYFQTGEYSIVASEEGFSVELDGVAYFTLRAGSGLHTAEGEDVDSHLSGPEIVQAEGGQDFVWKARSSRWEEKRYILECREGWFRYRLKVTGKGRLQGLDYFSGASRDKGSAYEAGTYLYPVAVGGGSDFRYYTTAQSTSIELGYLVPPLFCYPFNAEDCPRWLGLGLAPGPGEYNFDRFSYVYNVMSGGRPRCYLQTDFLGYTQVDGEWEAPAVLGVTGGEEFAVLSAYSEWLYEYGGCIRPVRKNPEWWLGPLFCGWGEQNNYLPGRPQEAATQAAYEGMSARLDELGLEPTAIIIDDKWQTWYGESLPDTRKWPDMRAYVDAEHKKGRKVMLWFKAWDSEGLPSDECVVLWGQQMGADPTNPRYQKRVREMMRHLLSDEPGCCNCDGFKVDFANCMPLGRNLRTHESGVYGVELLKRFFLLFRDEAKAVKQDVLINCSCGHPYFAEVTDQSRLHDYYWGMRSAKSVMSFRRDLVRCAMPDVLIDTDGVGATHREAMAYMRFAPELGVPDLYTLNGGSDYALSAEDWAEIRDIWAAYARKVRGR